MKSFFQVNSSKKQKNIIGALLIAMSVVSF